MNNKALQHKSNSTNSKNAQTSSLTHSLPLSLTRCTSDVSVSPMSLSLFGQVIMKMFRLIETKANPSQSNNGTAGAATGNNNTAVTFLRQRVGVAEGRQISNSRLIFGCPLNRWKNVNISYALWVCQTVSIADVAWKCAKVIMKHIFILISHHQSLRFNTCPLIPLAPLFVSWHLMKFQYLFSLLCRQLGPSTAVDSSFLNAEQR